MKKNLTTLLLMLLLFVGVVCFSNTKANAAASVPITNFHQSDASTSSINVAWSYLGEANSYIVYKSYDKKNWVETKETYHTYSSLNITGLDSGITIYVRVVPCSDYSAKTPIESDSSSVLECVTFPERVQNVTQVAAAKNAVTMQWSKVNGATGYQIYMYSNSTSRLVGTVGNVNQFTVTGLAAGSQYNFYVRAFRKAASTGVVGYGTSSSTYDGDAKTMLNPITSFGIANAYTNINVYYVGWNTTSNNADGYEVVFYNHKGKVVQVNSEGNTNSSRFEIKNGVFYKYRLRPYITVAGRKVYSSWSSFKYLAVPKKVTTKLSGKRNIKISWKKVSGASSYTIYGSTKKSSGYKKIKKLSSKKTSFIVKKIKGKKLKKRKTYYIQIKVQKKEGKKTISSSVNLYAQCRIY